jgi:hypothetical protein
MVYQYECMGGAVTPILGGNWVKQMGLGSGSHQSVGKAHLSNLALLPPGADVARLNKAPIAMEAVKRIDALFEIERGHQR